MKQTIDLVVQRLSEKVIADKGTEFLCGHDKNKKAIVWNDGSLYVARIICRNVMPDPNEYFVELYAKKMNTNIKNMNDKRIAVFEKQIGYLVQKTYTFKAETDTNWPLVDSIYKKAVPIYNTIVIPAYLKM
jgi:hypothetical protein